jgi:hypothetical protein
MVLISCDLCGKEIQPETGRYYVVRMEVLTRGKTGLVDEDLADDNLEAVSQLLQDADDDEVGYKEVPPRETMKFDLCPNCRNKFVKDPLNRESLSLDFSSN